MSDAPLVILRLNHPGITCWSLRGWPHRAPLSPHPHRSRIFRNSTACCTGNHFNEFAGFDCDYTRYPGPDVQRSFIREYLMEAAGSNAEPVRPPFETLEAALVQFRLSGVDIADMSLMLNMAMWRLQGDAEVEALLKETNVCALASHLFWGLWSVLQVTAV